VPVDSLDAQLPKARSLALLADDVRCAVELVQALRRAPKVQDRLLAARHDLLIAMESYAAELTARGLPVPRRLHSDLRLHRDIGRQGDTLV
jgi:hypothetical protein